MSYSLTVTLADDEMDALVTLAEDQCRTPEAQVHWQIRRALAGARRRTDGGTAGDPQPLFTALTALHLAAGAPTTRKLAPGAGMGHSSVNAYLRGVRVPPWPALKGLVTAMGGDVEHFRQLWITAQSGDAQAASAAA
jgi:hypothetical protein